MFFNNETSKRYTLNMNNLANDKRSSCPCRVGTRNHEIDQLNYEQPSIHLQYSIQTVQRCGKWLRVMPDSTAYAQTVQRCVKQFSVMPHCTAYTQMVQRCVKQLSVMPHCTAYTQMVQRCVKGLGVMSNGTAYIKTVQRCVKIYQPEGHLLGC